MEAKPFLIGGGWRTSSHTQEVRSPFNGDLVAHFSVASAEELEEAISSAASAAREMRALPRHEVAESLRRVADRLRERREEFARTIALEAGKPLRAARAE